MFIAYFLVVLIVVDRSLGFVLKVFSHLKNGTMLKFYKLLLLGFIMYCMIQHFTCAGIFE